MDFLSPQYAAIHARQPQYRQLVLKTQHFIDDCIATLQNPAQQAYCACSFGKDSSVLLHLLIQRLPEIKTVFVCYPETELLDNYSEVISKWKCNLTKLFIDADIEQEVNEKDIIPNWAMSNGYTLGFVGIRAEESKPRLITLKKCGMLYQYKNDALSRATPLAWWKNQDIAAYIYTHQLPLLNTYKSVGIIQRTTSGLADDNYGFRKAQLLRLKQSDITRYNKIILQYPQLAQYA